MKPQKRPLDGVLLLDKATGLSSNSALQQARRLYHAECSKSIWASKSKIISYTA